MKKPKQLILSPLQVTEWLQALVRRVELLEKHVGLKPRLSGETDDATSKAKGEKT